MQQQVLRQGLRRLPRSQPAVARWCSNKPVPPVTPVTHSQEPWDAGRILMNVGAVASLTGFMMTDVLYLRALSVFGSFCGVTYNATRAPRQYNGMAWGCVFMATNVVMIYKLVLERQEVELSEQQLSMFRAHFECAGIERHRFMKLCKIGQWEEVQCHGVVVPAGEPLAQVVYIHEGVATAFSNEDPPLALYEYHGVKVDRVGQGCVIGGTALIDQSVRARAYPNVVRVTSNAAVLVRWGLEELDELLETEPELQYAFMRMLYVDLIEGLRRQRRAPPSTAAPVQQRPGDQQLHKMQSALDGYHQLLSLAVADGVVHPAEKRVCREHKTLHRISAQHHAQLLANLGWRHAAHQC
eukprot:TRINITY_DN4554_c0_g1_i3.p1 TRINITY_DN4554_c0_g1~~TRINITY_DN4554_c0_g1_i3.p1  ORF type:complete len:354 (-),score=94.17 TRINITY_DN4554_c0_g1_i3:622-1683(-)